MIEIPPCAADFARLMAAENAPNRGFDRFAARFIRGNQIRGHDENAPDHGNSAIADEQADVCWLFPELGLVIAATSLGIPRVARVISNFWMFVGVVFVALYTAQLTATLTVQQIRGAIEGPGDLPGKQVATVAGTTAVNYLREHNAQVQEFPTPDQMFKALLDKKVDAVVSARASTPLLCGA